MVLFDDAHAVLRECRNSHTLLKVRNTVDEYKFEVGKSSDGMNFTFRSCYANKDTANLTNDGMTFGVWKLEVKSGSEIHLEDVEVTSEVLEHMNGAIEDGVDDFIRITACSQDMAFLYLDISDFSTFPSGIQSYYINALSNIVDQKIRWEEAVIARLLRAEDGNISDRISRSRDCLDRKISIGDGFIYAFKDTQMALWFGIYLARIIDEWSASEKTHINFHFRMGLHFGPVYSFWEKYDEGNGMWNFVGEGINGGQRVLSAIGKEYDDLIYVSYEARSKILQDKNRGDGDPLAAKVLRNLKNRGRRKDKHNKPWRVYELDFSSVAY